MDIHQIKTYPYHYASNGLVEQCVQTFKNAMYKMTGPIQYWLSGSLLHYHTTPHKSTSCSPAELLMERELWSQPNLLLPHPSLHIRDKVPLSQMRQKAVHDSHSKLWSFQKDDHVLMRNLKENQFWPSRQISGPTSSLSYCILLGVD